MAARLDLEHLQTLVAIADTGSFAAAAERVYRTQSAVSMQMKRLEETVGQALFEKQGRRAVLTMAGQNLLLYARRLVSLQDEALAQFREAPATGEVRVGVCDDYVLGYLPPVLKRFATRFPQVHIRLVCESSAQLQQATRADELDFAIINVADPDLPHEALRREPLLWVASRDHLPQEQRPLPIAIERDCAWAKRACNALDVAGIDYRIAYSTFNTGGIVAIVEAGLAVGMMGRNTMSAGMRVLGEADGFPRLPDTTVGLVLRSTGVPPAAEALIAVIRETFGVEPLAA